MKKRLFVFDLDGVLLDSSHRYRTISENGVERIDLDHWRENEPYACRDSFLSVFFKDYLPALDNPENIVCAATARVLNRPDRIFLSHYMPRPDFIISRPNGSSISGGKLKVSGIKKLLNLRQFSQIEEMYVYEDNLAYLSTIVNHFGYNYPFSCRGVYIPSIQGH